jgi:quinolinate synthase
MGKDYLPLTVDATARLKMRENVSMSTPARSTSLTDLLLLGQGRDLASERGVSCTGELPEASDPDLISRARAARAAIGDRALVLGHHYQRDEVIEFADVTGDSFKLAQAAAAQSSAEYIIFCGVHFMAESADILTSNKQKVILPDLAAGCSMADMATANQVTQCWKDLEEVGVADKTIPVTYMNSSAAIKSFTGEHGGTICTSSNAKKSMEWALSKGEKILFLPDQHLGRNTAVLSLGLTLDDCVLWNPWKPMGGLTTEEIRGAKVILWRGHCSVHGRFTLESVNEVRKQLPEVKVLVHPECQHEVVAAADVVGSTEMIIKTVEQSPAGSAWAIGTELNLVSRLAKAHHDKKIVFLDKTVCYCSTMNRIDLPHLVWAMESLVDGHVVNQISVAPDVAKYSKLALEQMLAL